MKNIISKNLTVFSSMRSFCDELQKKNLKLYIKKLMSQTFQKIILKNIIIFKKRNITEISIYEIEDKEFEKN